MAQNPSKLGPHAPQLTEGGIAFRDLNKNGRLDPYKDHRRPIDEWVEDLLSQMSLQEKAGMMFHMMIGMNQDGSLQEEPGPFSLVATTELVSGRPINHYSTFAGILQSQWPNGTVHFSSWRSAPAWTFQLPSLPILATHSAQPQLPLRRQEPSPSGLIL